MTRPDDELADELAALLAPGHEPPADVLRAARGVFTWRTVDAELAELTYDSVLDDPVLAGEPAAVRTGAQPRILSFEAGHLTIEVEVDETPGGRRLLGQLTPPGPAALELTAVDGAVERGRADEIGRFALALPVGRQQVRMRCTPPDGSPVDSAWISL